MYHQNYTTYLQKELDFLKLLVSRFHEQEKVNGLELDVALLKTQEIYDQLLRIKLVPENAANEIKSTPPEPVVTPTSIAVEQKITKPEPPKKEPQEVEKIEQIPICEEKKPQIKPEILAEKISPSDFHPINETLAQQKTGGDLSSKWQTAPLTSIVAGIGLNDKFLYIRELFNSDNALYSNAIKYLDTTDSLEDALNYIRQYFDWDEKDETVQSFLNLVHRRHVRS